MIDNFAPWLLLALVFISGCRQGGYSACDSALDQITHEVGSDPRDSIWLPLVDTTTDFFCDTSLIDSLRAKWNFQDTSIAGFGKQMNVIRIISVGPYQAKISILDKDSLEVRSLVQYFGLSRTGSCRGKQSRKLSFLVWDMRNKNDEQVADGIYNWKITFSGYFGEYSTSMKTGVVLNSCENGIE